MSADCVLLDIFSIYGQFVVLVFSDSLSVKLTFSLKVTFYLKNTENRIRKSLTQLSHYSFE